MLAPNPHQLRLLRLLDENNGLYNFDEQLEPFSDDVLHQCFEAGWIDGEACNHADLIYVTEEGRAFARAINAA